MADKVLELKNVTAGYGPTHVLRGITLSVAPGERLAVIGRNGAGKTTLLSTIMGLTRMHGGSVHYGGREIDRLAPYRRNALGLGLVPQTRDIFPSLTVEENLLSCLRGDASLEEAYALFPRLKERRKNGGTQLSGGEQQMLSIARTLMTRPDVLLLDEPLEGLAPVICEQLMAVFEELAKDGSRAVVLVEQHAEAALAFATRAALMANGAIVHEGPAEALRRDAELLHRHVGVAMSA
ncbi:ABC transporter ATP-binding protein [Alloyangia pacifica]|uniref:Branched-chain amino acid transport system ATP-binding protein n=1 Tax=Alloyangia pacifica TaxID=311180 RepID=A0A1I6VFZ2_9RHOB|nr:ABC transporter ATP-binding protein [Alloyangia pacifica]SDH96061.1 amino acid/amide ABC transporter ATP-binding protein 2, HAAT family [Alloyangia pacifica]SFT12599.1 branched-chain amino acid transport system ATP-binding protein [Alloyangia pacifica]